MNAEAGGAADEVEGIEVLLDVEEGDVPGAVLRGENGFEGFRSVAVPAAGVMIDDRQFTQALFDP